MLTFSHWIISIYSIQHSRSLWRGVWVQFDTWFLLLQPLTSVSLCSWIIQSSVESKAGFILEEGKMQTVCTWMIAMFRRYRNHWVAFHVPPMWQLTFFSFGFFFPVQKETKLFMSLQDAAEVNESIYLFGVHPVSLMQFACELLPCCVYFSCYVHNQKIYSLNLSTLPFWVAVTRTILSIPPSLLIKCAFGQFVAYFSEKLMRHCEWLYSQRPI